jgi:hypothetical protein
VDFHKFIYFRTLLDNCSTRLRVCVNNQWTFIKMSAKLLVLLFHYVEIIPSKQFPREPILSKYQCPNALIAGIQHKIDSTVAPNPCMRFTVYPLVSVHANVHNIPYKARIISPKNRVQANKNFSV